mmetsp:Transcript_85474/g.155683  ORF Transcript_85474/g.155683 Transcript_85474/m.155683 type:complete len:97 (+) Transcript_85474:1014-1304(+)
MSLLEMTRRPTMSRAFWVSGSQDAVFQAEKLVRTRMFESTPCRFGDCCTDRACKFRHPHGHSVLRAKKTAWRESGQQELCAFGKRCRHRATCTFRH